MESRNKSTINKEAFGKFLKRLRKGRGWTLDQAKDATGLSASYISLLERGRRGFPRFTQLQSIARGYNYGIMDILKQAHVLSGSTHLTNIEGLSPSETQLLGSFRELSASQQKVLFSFLGQLKAATEESRG